MTDAPLKPCLLPCPFCGGEGQPSLTQAGGIEWAQVECVERDCHTHGPCRGTEAEAITAWNKRATRPDPAPTGEVTRGDREAAAAMWDTIQRCTWADWRGDWLRDGAGDSGPLTQAFRNHRLRSVAPLEAEVARLREALEEAEEVFSLVEHPALTDPDYHSEIYELGARIGFGALMSGASAEWRKSAIVAGSEFVAGPCQATVTRVLAIIRLALSPDGDASEGGG